MDPISAHGILHGELKVNGDGKVTGLKLSPAKLVFVCVNGILSRPGASDGWTDRAVTWLQCNSPHKAEKWEYAAGPILRRIRQSSRAKKIATMLAYYERAGFEIILVAHSNGCDLVSRVLALRGAEPWYFQSQIRSAHLFAAATDWLGLHQALDGGSLKTLHLYGSDSDWALKFARVSRWLGGWAGLGYGSLGLHGDIVESDDLGDQLDQGRGKRVFDHGDDKFGHSDWFERGPTFEGTMIGLLHHERSA